MNETPLPGLIGVPEVCDILGITRNRVAELTDEGEFEARKISGVWVYRESSVRRFAKTYVKREWAPGKPLKKNS